MLLGREIQVRLELRRRYAAWRSRIPWRLLPRWAAPRLFSLIVRLRHARS